MNGYNKKLQNESKARFKLIYELTLKVTNLSPKHVPVSHGYSKCWSEIIDFWFEYSNRSCFPNVMYAALFHMSRNQYPSDVKTDDMRALILLIEEELRGSGYAFMRWVESFEFVIMLYTFIGEDDFKSYCSETFRTYGISKMLLDLFHNKPRVPICYIHCSSESAQEFCKKSIEAYNRTICKLLPEANRWTDEWMDEKLVLRRIKEVYSVDFSKSGDAFDQLMHVAEEMLDKKQNPHALLNVSVCTIPLLRVLWGKNTEKKLVRYFQYAYDKCMALTNPNFKSVLRNRYSFECLQRSWVCQTLADMESQKNPLITPEIKKKLFNVMIGREC